MDNMWVVGFGEIVSAGSAMKAVQRVHLMPSFVETKLGIVGTVCHIFAANNVSQ